MQEGIGIQIRRITEGVAHGQGKLVGPAGGGIELLHPFAQRLHERLCFLLLGLGADDDEFVSGKTEGHVFLCGDLRENLANAANGIVPHGMAELVVDALEVVYIRHNAGYGFVFLGVADFAHKIQVIFPIVQP